jgi:hypothetical protein
MKTKGISGIAAIIIIIILLLIGYMAYQMGRLQFTYSAVKEKATDAAKIGLAQNDQSITEELIKEAGDLHVVLKPEQIYVDHSIFDSLRIYVAYNDSSNIFGMVYHKSFVIDVIQPIKVRY